MVGSSTSSAGRRGCTRPPPSRCCSSTRCRTRAGSSASTPAAARARHRGAPATRARARSSRSTRIAMPSPTRVRTSRAWRPSRSAPGCASAASPSSRASPATCSLCNPPQRPKVLWADLPRARAATVLRRRGRRPRRRPSGADADPGALRAIFSLSSLVCPDAPRSRPSSGARRTCSASALVQHDPVWRRISERAAYASARVGAAGSEGRPGAPTP